MTVVCCTNNSALCVKKGDVVKLCLTEVDNGIPGNGCAAVGHSPSGPGLCCQEP